MGQSINTTETIFSIITERIASTAGIAVEKITPESLFQNLGMDSLDALAMMSDLEEEFKIKIPNQELLKVRTVGQAVEAIQKRLS